MSPRFAIILTVLIAQVSSEIPLPRPTGRFPVGVTLRDWTDSTRVDSIDPGRPRRRVQVVIWYPAADSIGRPARYVAGLDSSAGELGALHARVKTNARLDRPFSAASRAAPVIVLAPGRIAAAFDYSSLAEDLASHGYVVVGVNSPGHSKIFLPDGSIAPVAFRPMPPNSYPNGFDEEQVPMNTLVSADLRFAIDRVERFNRSDSLMRGRLDLERVAMMGHSNGAMSGSRACAQHLRCKAFLGIEGSQTREIRLGGNDKPFGLVYGEQTLSFDSLGVFTALQYRGRAPYTFYRVAGAGHNSFNDLLLVRPTLFNYPLAPQRGVEITRAIVRGFFEEFLLGTSGADALRDFTEVAVVKYPAGRAPVEAQLFGEGVFSTSDYELPPTFDPDGNRAYFTISTPVYGRMRWIMESRRISTGWSAPAVAPFSGTYDDADPYISPDGSQLFFLSKRPIAPGQPAKRDLDIWVMKRNGAGWGSPSHLGMRVNGPSDEHYVTATRDGTLIIAAVRADSRGLGDLYEVPLLNGEYGEPRNLGPTINGPDSHETTPWVSPDGRFIIFGARGRSDSYGDIDLYVTVRDSAGGQWGKPVNLGPHINSRATDYCPLVSPDGKYLYFSSTRSFYDDGMPRTLNAQAIHQQLHSTLNGLGDTYRIQMTEVERVMREHSRR
jgi:hypothetical protein